MFFGNICDICTRTYRPLLIYKMHIVGRLYMVCSPNFTKIKSLGTWYNFVCLDLEGRGEKYYECKLTENLYAYINGVLILKVTLCARKLLDTKWSFVSYPTIYKFIINDALQILESNDLLKIWKYMLNPPLINYIAWSIKIWRT